MVINMEKIIIKTEGMHCEGCENRIKNSLMSIEGVKDVQANHSTGEVIVEEENANIEEIKEQIEDLGFEVKENQNENNHFIC